MNWSVNILTVHPERPTLPGTRNSVRAAGWERHTVWPDRFEGDDPVGHIWARYAYVLSNALDDDTDADWLLMLQDDIRLTRWVRRWLERLLEYPIVQARHHSVISLYTPAVLRPGQRGWQQLDASELHGAWGACALAFPREVADALSQYQPPKKPQRTVDGRVVQFCRETGTRYYFHRPSLCQHVGVDSLLHRGQPLNDYRQADEFAGDVSELGWDAEVGSQNPEDRRESVDAPS